MWESSWLVEQLTFSRITVLRGISLFVCYVSPFVLLVGWLVGCWLVFWLVGWYFDLLVVWLVCLLLGWLFGLLVCVFVGWLVG